MPLGCHLSAATTFARSLCYDRNMSSKKDSHWQVTLAAPERSHDHITRLLALLRTFHQRGELTREDIVAELNHFYGPQPDRAVRRDIAALAGRNVQELDRAPDNPPPHGFDIRHDRAGDRFILVASDLMPRLTRDEHETLQAVYKALGNDPLLGRRVEELLERLTRDGTAPTLPSVWLNLGLATDYTPHKETLLRLVKAAREQRSVEFEYRSLKAIEGRRHRKVDVYPLELSGGHYYFDGYHHEANAFITYRVDRIEPGSLHILPDYGSRRQRSKPLVSVSYWLSPDLVTGGVSHRLLDQREHPTPDGGLVITGKARSIFHVRRLLLGYGPLARAIAPPELVAQLRQDIQAMDHLYRASNPIAPSD